MKFFKRLSLVPKGLRYKLMIAFCLMSIIPLLVAGYLVRDDIFPPTRDIIRLSWILLFCIIIACLGLVLAKQMVEPVIEMAVEAKLIVGGDFTRRITTATEDEVGDIGNAINQLTSRIKNNMNELKSFGEKTKLINIEIHKRILAMSSLLQIGESISTASEIEDVMTLVVDKVAQVMDSGYAMLFLPKADRPDILECNVSHNVTNDNLSALEIKIGAGVLGEAISRGRIFYVDSNSKTEKDIDNIKKTYGLGNFSIFPILAHGAVVGALFVGNNADDFSFKDDDIELIKVFAKQAAIAYESDRLTKKARELAITDDLTGLYNGKYIEARLDEEIKRALMYQRPCSYITFDVDDFGKFREQNGELATEKTLIKVACVLKDNVTQIGRAARIAGNKFALLLPEKNKKEAYRIAEKVRKETENLDLELKSTAHITISGGVSENPLDGSTAKELMDKAESSLSTAKSQGKNRIT